jgi:hypothetical protein
MSQILEDKDLGLKEPVDSLESPLRRAETEVQTGMSKRKTKESPQRSKTSHVSFSYLCTFRYPKFYDYSRRNLTVTPRHHTHSTFATSCFKIKKLIMSAIGLIRTKLVEIKILSESFAEFKVLKQIKSLKALSKCLAARLYSCRRIGLETRVKKAV